MGTLDLGAVNLSGTDPHVCIDLISGMWIPPEYRGKDWVVPRLDGQVAGNRRKDKLILPLAGIISGVGLPQFNDNVAAVMAVMDATLGFQELAVADGYLGLDSGVVATIQVRFKDASPGRIDGYNSGFPTQRWTFELEALDPEWVFGT